MKMYELIVCCAVLTAAMPACQSQPTTVIVPVRRDRGTPPKADSPASRAAPPGSVATVRQSELVKVYGVNRYVDPSDPAIMHERHAIYLSPRLHFPEEIKRLIDFLLYWSRSSADMNTA
jgi:hypothetical protein